MAECALSSCDRPAPDAVVCSGCATHLAARLREAADLWPELAPVIARQGRQGDPGPRPRGRAPAAPIRPDSGRLRHYADQVAGWPSGLVVDLAASEVRDAAVNALSTWARVIADETGADWPASVSELLRWLAGRMEWIRHQPWAAECVDELGEVPGMVWRAVDRHRPPRRYLGPCMAPTEDGDCEGELHHPPGAEWVTCPECGGQTQVPERRRWLDGLVAERSYTAAEIEDAYGVRASRIRQWAHRGRLAASGPDRMGRPLYRLRDVLGLAREHETKRAKRERMAA